MESLNKPSLDAKVTPPHADHGKTDTYMPNLMNTYLPLPVTFVRGEGVWLWDEEGKRYLDALAGVAVCGLGHCHPELVKAICKQAGTLIHTSNLYHIGKQEQLATRLAFLSGMDNAFFCNSGAEANEAAIKLARLYGHGKNIDLPTIISAPLIPSIMLA